MEHSHANRLALLQSAALKSAETLVRQRQRIDDLSSEGERTTEAEAVFQRLDAARQALLAKLAFLKRESVA